MRLQALPASAGNPVEREVLSTSFGGVEIVTEGGRLTSLSLGRKHATPGSPWEPIAKELDRFFCGEVRNLSDIPVDLRRSTEFERRVYEATRRIPFGELATYSQVANAIGQPGAPRAVGQALGKNPIGIVIPCHRVVGSDGIGGFTGLVWKRKPLRFEGSLASVP